MTAGIISPFLVWAALLSFVLRLRNGSNNWRMIGAAVIVLSAAIPLTGLLIPFYIRGAIGDLSVVTQLLLAIYTINSLAGITSTAARKAAYRHFALFIVITACWFYPTTLGLTYFDPYSFGYNSSPLHWTVVLYFFCGALTCFYLKSLWISGILCIATLAFVLNTLESDNYWDYMLDPVLVIGAFFYLVTHAIKVLLKGQSK